jgi:hypothetical protein
METSFLKITGVFERVNFYFKSNKIRLSIFFHHLFFYVLKKKKILGLRIIKGENKIKKTIIFLKTNKS